MGYEDYLEAWGAFVQNWVIKLKRQLRPLRNPKKHDNLKIVGFFPISLNNPLLLRLAANPAMRRIRNELVQLSGSAAKKPA